MNASVSLYWAVPQTIWEKEIISLTGSATVLQIWWKKILVDLWLFQWWEWSDLFNKENIDFLKWIDGVVISHAHIDHIWRLPLLAKMGFKWAIYMTPATKSITIKMLLDSLKIQEWEVIENLNRNKKLWFRIKESLKIKKILLQKTNLSNTQKWFIEKVLPANYDKQTILNQIQEYHDYYQVKDENDIKWVIERMKESLFSLENLDSTMELVQSIDYSEEKIINSTKISAKNKNKDNQDILDALPLKIVEWFDEYIAVDTKSEKRKLKQKWEENLKITINNVIENSAEKLDIKREEFKKELEAAFTYCERYNYLENDEYKNRNEYREIKKELRKNQRLLNQYWIQTRKHIEHVIDDDELLVDVLKIDIPFNSEDIKLASLKLEVTNNSNIERNIIGISLFDAAHIVWSAGIVITSWIVREKVNNLLDINWSATTVCFSWDLWRIEYNRLNRPEITPLPVDYLQIESTYWWKNHVNRIEAVENLTNSIQKSKWDVLISVFSQQRCQEILLTILEEKIKKWVDFLDYEILVDAPLAKEISDIYKNYMWDTFNLLDEEVQKEVFWKKIFRFLDFEEWENLYQTEEKIKSWEKDKIKITHEHQENKKRIILASSGMMDWWAIMNHLPFILENPNATILAPGYLSEWTLWKEIVFWESCTVTINWEKIQKSCNTKFIDGFSSHIWHDEILQYITETIKEWKIKKWATIALTHWNIDWQESLQKDIFEILKWFDRTDVKVIIPEMYTEYCIKTNSIKKLQWESCIIREVKKKNKPVVPEFLIKIKDNKNDEYILEDRRKSSIDEEKIKHKNEKRIRELNKKWTDIEKQRTDYIKSYLPGTLNSHWIDGINKIVRNISNAVSWQKKVIIDTINKKLTRNRVLKTKISRLKSQKTILINNVFDDIIYNYNLLYSYLNETGKDESESKIFANKIKKVFNNLCSNKLITNKCDEYINNFHNKSLDESDLIEEDLENLIFKVIADIDADITIMKAELDSDFKISLKKKEAYFNWEKICSKLYTESQQWINLDLLDQFITQNIFNDSELYFINQKIEIIQNNNSSTKKIRNAEKNLKKFFKQKEQENKNLWSNINIPLDQLHNECLTILWSVFEKDYFNDYISVQFNIYLFIKSNSSLEEYIKSKFDLEKLKWISKWLSEFDYISEQLENQKKILKWLEKLNHSSKWEESLFELEHLIQLTWKEIDEIICRN
jgi:Cft2 family RNA processing exonuclease